MLDSAGGECRGGGDVIFIFGLGFVVGGGFILGVAPGFMVGGLGCGGGCW